MSVKLTLATLRNLHYFDIPALAEKAGVNPSAVDRMLCHQPVQRYQAELVLTARSDELGMGCTLDTVSITLAPEEGEKKS